MTKKKGAGNKMFRNIVTAFAAGVFMLTAMVFDVSANDLKLTDGTVVSINKNDSTAVIQFDISWENSWRDNINHDAVWLFIKYSTDGGAVWNHATLGGPGIDPEGYSSGEGTSLEIAVPSDRKGCFLRRPFTGTGKVDVSAVKLVWTYDIDGLVYDDMRSADLKVFGIEMVYIPEGAFFAGDHEISDASFTSGSDVNATAPWYIQSESAVSVTGASAGTYYYRSGGNPGENDTGSDFVIPASFPKGFMPFYIMKYGITEEQWVDFFNVLSGGQKIARDITGSDGKNTNAVVERNTIAVSGSHAVTTRSERLCGFLSWQDITAYADWAALRPVTELEYEKAARGRDISPLGGEYAWGSAAITGAAAISGPEDGTEIITTSGANACYGNIIFTGGDGGRGPLRAGIFAKSTTTRSQAGSSFYGVKELSGSLWERVVTVGNSAGRAFQGSHGDGELTSYVGHEGNASISDWPGYEEGEGVTSAEGSGLRGGSYAEVSASRLRISDRAKAALGEDNRRADAGGRAARTAP